MTRGAVITAWRAKKAAQGLYSHTDEALEGTWIDELVIFMSDRDCPAEVQTLGRTLIDLKEVIDAWYC